MFKVNLTETNWPREVCSAVSVAQTGVIAFKIPILMLMKTRARLVSIADIALDIRTNRRTSSPRFEQSTEWKRPHGPDRSSSNSFHTAIAVIEPASKESAKKSHWKIIHSVLFRVSGISLPWKQQDSRFRL